MVLNINEDTYEWFAALSAELKSGGESISYIDELIAAIIMINRAAIVSRDTHLSASLD
jgi:predicted nucleic acid-binding protein